MGPSVCLLFQVNIDCSEVGTSNNKNQIYRLVNMCGTETLDIGILDNDDISYLRSNVQHANNRYATNRQAWARWFSGYKNR